MTASNTGFPYHVAIYQGKENGGDSDKPLGYCIVTSSLSPCANPSDHHVFFDNFFSSYQLMKTLPEKGFKTTGTFRADRTNGCPLKCVKEFKKMDRGEYQYFTSGDQIELIRWNNNVVTIGRNAVIVKPVGNVKRWKQGKQSVNVSQPQSIQQMHGRH